MKLHRKKKSVYTKRFLVFGAIVVCGFIIGHFLQKEKETKNFLSTQKEVTIAEGGVVYGAQTTQAKTVAEFLEQNEIYVSDDEVFPSSQSQLYEGMHIDIRRNKVVQLINEGKAREIHTDMSFVNDFLYENNIVLHKNDFVLPSLYTPLRDGDEVQIIRVSIEEESIIKDVKYKTITKKDDDMGWQDEKIEQKGQKGKKEKVYQVTYHNGEEIEREFLHEKVIKEPVTEIVKKGTYVKLGKSHKGQASWYAWTGTMAAANPWLPKGSYVKVTNRANGKSVIVVINDRGPFVPGRIIDLDKVAFEKIASLGAGVIDIKMEEIEN
jgi:uncharacterized protein YabE (DUF348 family)